MTPGGVIYHVFNRGNGRMQLFHKPADYEAFAALMGEVREQVPVRLLGYCLMPDHWHLVLWPKRDGELSRFMQRLSTAHVRRQRAGYPADAGGHLYQGRFKSFPVQRDDHLLAVLRFVEANPIRAKLAVKADEWKWSSFAARGTQAGREMLGDWPVERPRDWRRMVEGGIDEAVIARVRESVRRGKPFGSEPWVRRTAGAMGLGQTLRPRGRPRKVTVPPR